MLKADLQGSRRRRRPLHRASHGEFIPTTHYLRSLPEREFRLWHSALSRLVRAQSLTSAVAVYTRLLASAHRLCEAVYFADRILEAKTVTYEGALIALSVAIDARDITRMNRCLALLKSQLASPQPPVEALARFWVAVARAHAAVGAEQEARNALYIDSVIESVQDIETLTELAELLTLLGDSALSLVFVKCHGTKKVPLRDRTLKAFRRDVRRELLVLLHQRVSCRNA